MQQVFFTADYCAIVDETDPRAFVMLDADRDGLPPHIALVIEQYRSDVAAGLRPAIKTAAESEFERRIAEDQERYERQRESARAARERKAKGQEARRDRTPVAAPLFRPRVRDHAPSRDALRSNWLAQIPADGATRQTRLHQERMKDGALLRRHRNGHSD